MAVLQTTSNLYCKSTFLYTVKGDGIASLSLSQVHFCTISGEKSHYTVKAEAKRIRKNRRYLRRKDPKLDEGEQVQMWPYLETHHRLWKETGKQVLYDAEQLMNQANNRFALVLSIAKEANEYLLNNPEEALTKKPVLKVISDRTNERAGMKISDGYTDEWRDELQDLT